MMAVALSAISLFLSYSFVDALRFSCIRRPSHPKLNNALATLHSASPTCNSRTFLEHRTPRNSEHNRDFPIMFFQNFQSFDSSIGLPLKNHLHMEHSLTLGFYASLNILPSTLDVGAHTFPWPYSFPAKSPLRYIPCMPGWHVRKVQCTPYLHPSPGRRHGSSEPLLLTPSFERVRTENGTSSQIT